jgi:DNA repair protein RadC
LADQHLTHTLKGTLAMVDVKLLDHLVVTASDAVSLAERGML